MTTLEYQSPPASVAGLFAWKVWLRRLGPLLVLAIVFTFFALQEPARFLNSGNLRIMLTETAVIATAALGMTIIIISGGIDLSVGSNIALVTVVVAQLLVAGAAPWVAALGGIASAALVGLLMGGLITGLKLSSFIVTLGLWAGIRGLAKEVGKGSTVVTHRETWLDLLLIHPTGKLAWMVLPPGVWITAILALLVAGLLRYTKFGRHVFAIGSNEQTARLCGINVAGTKILLYTVAAIFVGVAGVLQFSYVSEGDPTTAMGMELYVIAAVVIGGASLTGGEGSVFGSLVGALFMTVINNGCAKMGMPNHRQEMITGAIIILAAAIDRLRQTHAAPDA